MNAECGVRSAESSAEPATAWTHSRRVIIALAACCGLPACLCRSAGVVAKGTLTFNEGRFRVGSRLFAAEAVGALTVERDLVTVHVGDLA